MSDLKETIDETNTEFYKEDRNISIDLGEICKVQDALDIMGFKEAAGILRDCIETIMSSHTTRNRCFDKAFYLARKFAEK